MSIQGKLARVIEANRIGGVKAYGEYDYNERTPLPPRNARLQELLEQSRQTGLKMREMREMKAKNWVQGHDEFIGKLVDPNREDHL